MDEKDQNVSMTKKENAMLLNESVYQMRAQYGNGHKTYEAPLNALALSGQLHQMPEGDQRAQEEMRSSSSHFICHPTSSCQEQNEEFFGSASCEPFLPHSASKQVTLGLLAHEEDAAIVTRIKENLTNASYSVLDSYEFEIPGENYTKLIFNMMENCKSIFFITTPSSLQCQYMKYYVTASQQRAIERSNNMTSSSFMPLKPKEHLEIELPEHLRVERPLKEDDRFLSKIHKIFKPLCMLNFTQLDCKSDYSGSFHDKQTGCSDTFGESRSNFNDDGCTTAKYHGRTFVEPANISHGITISLNQSDLENHTNTQKISRQISFNQPQDEHLLKSKANGKHIMFSYKWKDSLDLAKKIHDALDDEGYDTWFDQTDMRGDMLNKMAEAVDDAYVVLMFVSENYATSVNCEREAKYAALLNRPIIPIKQSHFQPDGWLSMLIAEKIYYKFLEKDNFDEEFQKLKKDIDESRNIGI